MKRSEAFDLLIRIRDEKDINIDEQIGILCATPTENVPSEIVQFIDTYAQRSLHDFIYNIAPKKPFFANICYNYNDDVSLYRKAFLSLLTHICITIDKNPELTEEINFTFNIEQIVAAITESMISKDYNQKHIVEIAHQLKVIFLNEE